MNLLKQKTLNGLFWSFADSFGAYFIRFGFSVAIARALAPSDYGLMGMIIIFIAIGNILSESGFGMALIQKKNATNVDFSTIFHFNLLVSLIIYAFLFISAQSIANFYDEQILVNVIRISALTIVFGALSSIPLTILSKELNFKKQAYISLISTLISGITGVIIAYNGFAVWALVFQTLAVTIIRMVGLWFFCKWRPSFIFNWKSLKELYSYGYKIFLQGISDVIFTKIYYPLIGKAFSATQLGYYTNATSFSEILVKQTTISYGRVLFPAMSTIQDDIEKLKHSYTMIFRLLSFFMFPITIIAIISSKSFVDFFLTNKWLPAVPYMQLFLLEGFFFSLYMLNQNTFNAIGKSELSLKVDIIKKVLMFSSLFIAFKYGIKALIIGQVMSSFIAFIYSLIDIKRRLAIKMDLILKIIFQLSIITILIFFIDYFVLEKYIEDSGVLLLCQVFFLTFLYLLAVYIFKISVLNEIALVFDKYLPIGIKRIITKRFEQ